MFSNISDKDFLKNIYYKKEFYANKSIDLPPKTCDERTEFAEFQAHQKLIKNYINPNTPYNNLLVMWGTGVGKTLGAIAIAESFRPYIKQIREKTSEKPEIFIISRDEARNNFFKELFSPFIDPPYVSEQEREKLNALRMSAVNKNALIRYKEFEKELINRVKQQGYYRFMGSTKFVNLALGITDNKTRKKTSKFIKNNNDGIIIVDEAHSMDDNDMVQAMKAVKERSTNLKIILLTATPMINKAREIVSMLNILNDNANIKYSDVFVSSSEFDDLKPNGLKIIAEASRGYVSYMSGHNPYTFPKKIEIGQIIKPFKYTKLIYIQMSKLQAETYDYYIRKKKIHISNIGGGRGILDMVLPDPSNKNLGIFDRSDIDQLMANAPRDWLNEHGIVIKKDRQTNEPYITGSFLKSPQLKKYSPKFDKMLHDIINTFKPDNGAGLVYNDQITGIGLKLFGQMLIENGIEKYDTNRSPEFNRENYNPDAKCVICGKEADYHQKNSKIHEFIPAKFVYLYGEISPQERNKRISLINSLNNDHGQIVKIILGSRITSESIDFKRLRNIFITNFQDNISTINQIIGRAIRHCSHVGLPDNQRKVEIYKYATADTIEIERYLINEKKHENIIKVEEVLKANAIDCSLNQLKCYWNPPKSVKLSDISKKTYNNYFYEDEIRYNQRQLMKLFRNDIIWTYDQLKKEILSKNPLNDEKYLAITLERMINDKTAIINRFNDVGYIIYSPNLNAYLFQPINNLDTTIPLLERFIPFRQIIPQQVSIINYLETLKKKDEKVFNLIEIIKKINETDDPHIYSRIISRLTPPQQQEVLEQGIIDENKKILNFFKPFLLTNKMLEESGYSSASLTSSEEKKEKNYIGHILAKRPRCLIDSHTWGTCSKDVRRIPDVKRVKENDIIIGFMDKHKNKMIFKLRPAQPKQKLDRRKIQKGFVCSQSSNKNEIIKIVKSLNINVDLETSIKGMCRKIEDELRKRELKDKGKVKWFYEFIELI